MKIKIIVLCAATLCLAIASCKKEESETNPYLGGLSVSTAIPYVREGAVVTIEADLSKLAASKGDLPKVMGMCWRVNTTPMTAKDTIPDISKVPKPITYTITAETLGSYNITCYVFADGFFNTSANTIFRVIDPEKSMSGLKGDPDVQVDDKKYRSVSSGDLTWLTDNLWNEDYGYSYREADVVDACFGRYYTWEEAMYACPDGWRLPTGDEFDEAWGDDAGSIMANAIFLEADMWEYWPQVKISNTAEFNAIPVGYMDLSQDESDKEAGFLDYACWWVSDEYDDGMAAYRYIIDDNPVIQKGKGNKTSLAMSVRCVKEN